MKRKAPLRFSLRPFRTSRVFTTESQRRVIFGTVQCISPCQSQHRISSSSFKAGPPCGVDVWRIIDNAEARHLAEWEQEQPLCLFLCAPLHRLIKYSAPIPRFPLLLPLLSLLLLTALLSLPRRFFSPLSELAKFHGILRVEKLTKIKTVNPYRGPALSTSRHREVKLRQVIIYRAFLSARLVSSITDEHLKAVLRDSFFRNKAREWKASEMNHWPTPGRASWYSECICWSKWTVNRQTSVYLEFMTKRETIGSRTWLTFAP